MMGDMRWLGETMFGCGFGFILLVELVVMNRVVGVEVRKIRQCKLFVALNLFFGGMWMGGGGESGLCNAEL